MQEIYPTLICSVTGSKCVAVSFAGADAQSMVERGDEDLSVADLSGPCPSRDGFDRTIHLIGGHGDFEAEFRQEIHGVFGAAVDFRVPLLSPVAFDFCYRHAAHSKPCERLSDFVEFEWLDNCDDEFHWRPLSPAHNALMQHFCSQASAAATCLETMPDAAFYGKKNRPFGSYIVQVCTTFDHMPLRFTAFS